MVIYFVASLFEHRSVYSMSISVQYVYRSTLATLESLKRNQRIIVSSKLSKIEINFSVPTAAHLNFEFTSIAAFARIYFCSKTHHFSMKTGIRMTLLHLNREMVALKFHLQCKFDSDFMLVGETLAKLLVINL